MDKPEIAQRSPYRITLASGTYWWCQCGKSSKQPFCDGSHKETGFSPLEVEILEEKEVSLCGCKFSKNKPFCDGTHNNLD